MRRRLGNIERLPVAKQPFDFTAQPVPVEIARHGEDRVSRPILPLVELPHVVNRCRPQRSLFAMARTTPRVRILLPAKLDHQLVARLIVNRPQFLQARVSPGLQLIRRQMRLPQQVGKQFKPRIKIVAQRRAVIRGLCHADRFTPLNAQILKIRNPRPAIARPGTAQHHLARQRSQPGPIHRIIAAPAGHQESKRRRLHRPRRLADQHHSIA